MEFNTNMVSAEDCEGLPIGEYPINLDSPEWDDMYVTEKIAACDMPQAYAESLTTEELAKYAVNYPLMVVCFLFDSLEDGMESLAKKSSAFRELFSRPDCTDALLKEYTNLSCDYEILEKSHDMITSNYEKECFLEAYFGVNYDTLTEEKSEKFLQKYEEQYNEQPEIIQDYSTSKIFYDGIMETMEVVPEDALIDSVKEDMISEGSINELSFTKTSPVARYIAFPGARYYDGYHIIKGKKVTCYKYASGDFSASQQAAEDRRMEEQITTKYTKLRSSTKRYNCHSYAWYSTREKNPLWINDPSAIYTNNPGYFTKWTVPMATPGEGCKMLFYNSSGLQHSAILTSKTWCRSKFGKCGVYTVPITEVKKIYDITRTEVYLKNY